MAFVGRKAHIIYHRNMDKCVKLKFTEGLNMYTYLMLTMRTEKFNQEHVAGHYE
ncbi:hypothetical protein GUF51_16235, partial [Xanthomonas citri pv. citri]|nr:hypothetical protein [Xanthomonas citri pv. citri]